jgi:hypothetical protein
MVRLFFCSALFLFSFAVLLFFSVANAFQGSQLLEPRRDIAQPLWRSPHLFLTTTGNANAGANKKDTTVPTEEVSLVQPKQPKVSVLLCPAQFCVPVDYQELFDNLKATRAKSQQHLPEIGTCRVAPLPRTEWIKVARQLPTKNFLDATLSAKTTLRWYFDAMETALAEIFAEEGHDTNICLIGHSIGGWVARGYMGGLSGCVGTNVE